MIINLRRCIQTDIVLATGFASDNHTRASENNLCKSQFSLCYTTLIRRLARIHRSRLSVDIALVPRAAHTCDVLTTEYSDNEHAITEMTVPVDTQVSSNNN